MMNPVTAPTDDRSHNLAEGNPVMNVVPICVLTEIQRFPVVAGGGGAA